VVLRGNAAGYSGKATWQGLDAKERARVAGRPVSVVRASALKGNGTAGETPRFERCRKNREECFVGGPARARGGRDVTWVRVAQVERTRETAMGTGLRGNPWSGVDGRAPAQRGWQSFEDGGETWGARSSWCAVWESAAARRGWVSSWPALPGDHRARSTTIRDASGGGAQDASDIDSPNSDEGDHPRKRGRLPRPEGTADAGRERAGNAAADACSSRAPFRVTGQATRVPGFGLVGGILVRPPRGYHGIVFCSGDV